jgi:hypothetical protein
VSVIERERVEEKTVTEADVLHRAADLLEEFGWCQGRMGSKQEGMFCISGAVNEAVRELGYNYTRLPSDPLYVSGTRFFGGNGPRWNDEAGRTKEEVVSALRSAAEACHV